MSYIPNANGFPMNPVNGYQYNPQYSYPMYGPPAQTMYDNTMTRNMQNQSQMLSSSLNNFNQQPQPQQPNIINGKIVDGEDLVKVTEVPIGGYGVFPRADLKEIYLKVWDENGRGTNIITFKPVEPITPENSNNQNNELTNLLLQKIGTLENKIDMICAGIPDQQSLAAVQVQSPIQAPVQSQPQPIIKKVEAKNGF